MFAKWKCRCLHVHKDAESQGQHVNPKYFFFLAHCLFFHSIFLERTKIIICRLTLISGPTELTPKVPFFFASVWTTENHATLIDCIQLKAQEIRYWILALCNWYSLLCVLKELIPKKRLLDWVTKYGKLMNSLYSPPVAVYSEFSKKKKYGFYAQRI